MLDFPIYPQETLKMLGMEKAMAAIEAKFIDTMNDRMEIRSMISATDLTLTSFSYWDGNLIAEQSFDLTPLVEAIEARIMG
jgi:hypothetical protein